MFSYKSRSTSVVLENAASLFCCEAQETPPNFPLVLVWVYNGWIFISGWTFPLMSWVLNYCHTTTITEPKLEFLYINSSMSVPLPWLDIHLGKICKQNSSIFCCWRWFLKQFFRWTGIRFKTVLMPLPCFSARLSPIEFSCPRLQSVVESQTAAPSLPGLRLILLMGKKLAYHVTHQQSGMLKDVFLNEIMRYFEMNPVFCLRLPPRSLALPRISSNKFGSHSPFSLPNTTCLVKTFSGTKRSSLTLEAAVSRSKPTTRSISSCFGRVT